MGVISGLGTSPGEGNGNSLQYSCLENSMDRVWQVTVHGVTELDRTEGLTLTLIDTLSLLAIYLLNFNYVLPEIYNFYVVKYNNLSLYDFYLWCHAYKGPSYPKS